MISWSITTSLPSILFPSKINSLKLSSTVFWIALINGLAPYSGSYPSSAIFSFAFSVTWILISCSVKRLTEQDINIQVTEKAKEKIAEEGYDPEYGARPLIRAIQKTVEDNLSELILDGNKIEGKDVVIDHDIMINNNIFTFNFVSV